jgi:hypothetical protein
MLRRSFIAAYQRRGAKGGGNTPFETAGKMGDSFEKLVERSQSNNPFPLTENMYDRVGIQRFSTNPADAARMPNKGKLSSPTENSSDAGMGLQRELDDMVDPTKLTKAQLPWERVYNPEAIKMSQLSEEYYYPPAPTEKDLKRRRDFYFSVVCLIGGTLYIMVALYALVPQGRWLATGTVGHLNEPSWGIPTKAPEGFEIVRLTREEEQQLRVEGKPIVLDAGVKVAADARQ